MDKAQSKWKTKHKTDNDENATKQPQHCRLSFYISVFSLNTVLQKTDLYYIFKNNSQVLSETSS